MLRKIKAKNQFVTVDNHFCDEKLSAEIKESLAEYETEKKKGKVFKTYTDVDKMIEDIGIDLNE